MKIKKHKIIRMLKLFLRGKMLFSELTEYIDELLDNPDKLDNEAHFIASQVFTIIRDVEEYNVGIPMSRRLLRQLIYENPSILTRLANFFRI